MNKTFSTLEHNVNLKKSTTIHDDDQKFSPQKHKLTKIKSNTKKEESVIADKTIKNENVSLSKNNGIKERNSNA